MGYFTRYFLADDSKNNCRYIYDMRHKKILVYKIPTKMTKSAQYVFIALVILGSFLEGGYMMINAIFRLGSNPWARYSNQITIFIIVAGILVAPLYHIWFENGFERAGKMDFKINEDDLIASFIEFKNQWLADNDEKTRKKYLRKAYTKYFIKGVLVAIVFFLIFIYLIYDSESMLKTIACTMIDIFILSIVLYMSVYGITKVNFITKYVFKE